MDIQMVEARLRELHDEIGEPDTPEVVRVYGILQVLIGCMLIGDKYMEPLADAVTDVGTALMQKHIEATDVHHGDGIGRAVFFSSIEQLAKETEEVTDPVLIRAGTILAAITNSLISADDNLEELCDTVIDLVSRQTNAAMSEATNTGTLN